MAGSYPFVSIIIPTRNRKNLLLNCLDALALQTYPASRFEIVVVDDASNDGTSEAAAEWVHAKENAISVNLIRLEKNSGIAGTRNVGMAHSKGELLAFTDDDCRPQPGWLEALAEDLQDSSIGGTGGPIQLLTSGNSRLAEDYMVYRHWYERPNMLNKELDFLIGGNCLFTREAIDSVGGFDVQFPAAEDTDIGRRIRKAGFHFEHRSQAILELTLRPALIDLFKTAYRYGLGAGFIAYRYPMHETGESVISSKDSGETAYSGFQKLKLDIVDRFVSLLSRWGRWVGYRRARELKIEIVNLK